MDPLLLHWILYLYFKSLPNVMDPCLHWGFFFSFSVFLTQFNGSLLLHWIFSFVFFLGLEGFKESRSGRRVAFVGKVPPLLLQAICTPGVLVVQRNFGCILET
jgi:hypothetical protein